MLDALSGVGPARAGSGELAETEDALPARGQRKGRSCVPPLLGAGPLVAAGPGAGRAGRQRARGPEAVTVPLGQGLRSLLGHRMLPELGSAGPCVPGQDCRRGGRATSAGDPPSPHDLQKHLIIRLLFF